jgi:3-dehydroquinate synthase
MPHTVSVPLGERSYNIEITESFAELGKYIKENLTYSKVFIICDNNVAAIYSGTVINSLNNADIDSYLFTFEAGESAKCLESANKLYGQLLSAQADRKSLILALGGGVTGDLAGFVASTFMRGIKFIQLPTSLLAQVDSSVGGKVAVNHPKGKNIIGTFHQPALVYTNISTLHTLPEIEFSAGMAEIIKHGIIRDKDYFEFIADNVSAIKQRDAQVMTKLISRSCQIKASVVAEDERETGVRAILNLGHTFGHAFESLTNYTGYKHGEAVAIGIMAASYLAEELFNFPINSTQEIKRLLEDFNLPTSGHSLTPGEIINSMFSDKKTENGNLRLVLPREIGKAEIVIISDIKPVTRAIKRVLP